MVEYLKNSNSKYAFPGEAVKRFDLEVEDVVGSTERRVCDCF